MKSDLFLAENEDLKLSSPYLGYEVLKISQKNAHITIYDLYAHLAKRHSNLSQSNFMNALTLLYVTGLLQFHKPYIEVIRA
jgi:Fe2+ or Zn2+ uptake regulation protein